jgi:ribosome-associated toxin RatA of RatAB toxin-antitoxin module
MPDIDKSVLVPYSAAQMYALVEDVAAYPQFLPWCAGTQIRARDPTGMDASVEIRYGGVQQSFTTHNTLFPTERIEMALREGPFSELSGTWRFTPLRADACKVQLSLHYAFSSALLEGLVGPVFHYIASTFVESFTKRAESLYGP